MYFPQYYQPMPMQMQQMPVQMPWPQMQYPQQRALMPPPNYNMNGGNGGNSADPVNNPINWNNISPHCENRPYYENRVGGGGGSPRYNDNSVVNNWYPWVYPYIYDPDPHDLDRVPWHRWPNYPRQRHPDYDPVYYPDWYYSWP